MFRFFSSSLSTLSLFAIHFNFILYRNSLSLYSCWQSILPYRVIPSLRIRHFGKTMTTEKAALQNAQLYFKKGKRLVLPIIVSWCLMFFVTNHWKTNLDQIKAMLYAGNYLMFIRSEQQLDRLMERVQRAVDQYSSDFGMCVMRHCSIQIQKFHCSIINRNV